MLFHICSFSLLLLRLNFADATITTTTTTRGAWLQSNKVPSEIVKNYEIHTPFIKKVSNQDDPKILFVQISQFTLHLELNHDFIHPKLTSQHFDQNGNEIIDKGHRNCFYQGTVEGHLDWHVSMSTCYGLQGSFGKQGSKTNLYHVEPLDQTNTELEQPHALYLDTEYSEQTMSCGASTHQPLAQNVYNTDVYPENKNAKQLRRRQVNGFYFVELAMINDMAQFNAFGRNLSNVLMRNLAIANHMDLLYRPLNIRVVLVSVETWTTGNRIPYPMNNEASLLLDNLSEYVPHVAVHDTLLLVTGIDLKGETLGTAFNGMMCDSHKSVGLIQDRLSSTEEIGSQASHELGHILNMAHDNGRECTCSDPVGVCIMAATSNQPPPTQWSSCSHSDLASGFIYKSLDRCLKNEPKDTVADPVCGNGVREISEDCDCGSLEECTDPCCNASTCTLHEGAQCSEGPCCSVKCQFLPQNSTCRVTSEECDIGEYCSGKSSDCPQDMYRQDGSPCGDKDQTFCFDGICQSLDRHCHRFFLTPSSVKECYTRYNIAGSMHGNCGIQNGKFVSCAPEHSQCGQLMCDGGTFQEQEVSLSVTIATRSTLVGSTFEMCTSFSSSPSLEAKNPGLVPDGIKCGNNSICISQVCTPLKSLSYIHPCPLGQNGKTCSGRGVCNNLNQCSCNIGFYGISCNESSSVTEISVNVSERLEVHVIAGAVIGGILIVTVALTVPLVTVCVMILNSRKAAVALKKQSLSTAKLGKGAISQMGSHDGLLSGSPDKLSISVHPLGPSCENHHEATLS